MGKKRKEMNKRREGGKGVGEGRERSNISLRLGGGWGRLERK